MSALTLGWSDSPKGSLKMRRMAGSAVRAALRFRSSSFPRIGHSSVLVVSPHPDDETFGCGGLLCLLSRNNTRADVAFITDGSASHPRHPRVPPAAIAAMRRDEARAAAGILGVAPENLWFLGVKDGTLDRLDVAQSEDVCGRIAGIIERVNPGTILLPCRRDGSSEHDAAFPIVIRAVQRSATQRRILEFAVWSWWNPTLLLKHLFFYRRVWRVDISKVNEVKALAAAEYASQLSPIPPDCAASLPPGFAAMFLCGEEFLFERP